MTCPSQKNPGEIISGFYNDKKTENFMICGEEICIFDRAIPVKCVYYGKEESLCIHYASGHYVCNECHASDSITVITHFCLSSDSRNPVEMAGYYAEKTGK